MLVTRMLRDSRIAAREAATMPFPNEETTPPVTKTYFAIYPARGEIVKFTGFFFLSRCSSSPRRRGPHLFLEKLDSRLRGNDDRLSRRTPTAPRPSYPRGARHEYFHASPMESPADAAARGG